MKIKSLLFLLIFFCGLQIFAQITPVTPHVSPSLRFTENAGQWDSKIRYKAVLDGGALYMENGGLTFNFYDKKKYRQMHHGKIKASDMFLNCHAFKVEFVNCNANSGNTASDKGSDYENFYLGSDNTKWKSNVKNYHKVRYTNLYNGIDYEAITTTRGIKYNFYLKKGADPGQISLRYTGVDKISLDKGTLQVKLSVSGVIEQKPYAYQMIDGAVVEVPCHYKLNKNILSFEFPSGYDKNYELVIDPILVFGAQSGSSADNFGMTATYDNAGNLIAGGTVFDNGYPTTAGAYQTTFTGSNTTITDVVVTKYNPGGTALLFSTYLGGLGAEIATSLIVDAADNVFLYGATSSTDFPMAGTPYDNSFNGGTFIQFPQNGTIFNGGTDIYVAKFNSNGTSLLASTFIGGSQNDGVSYPTANTTVYDTLMYNYGDQFRGEIQLDKTGNVYIASTSRSPNFPIAGGFDNTLGGYQDAVVFKLNTSLSTLVWSSFLGGTNLDAGYALIVNDSNMVYVTGGTASMNFPTTAGAHKPVYTGGKTDGYITKINAAGNAIIKSTFIGTISYDQSYFIQSDRIGRIYVYGQSLGSMPVIGAVYSNAGSHQFITRYDCMLANLDISTVFGSGLPKLDISPSAFSVDKCSGTINLSGWGGDILTGIQTGGMPTTFGAFQTSSGDGFNFYLLSLFPNASNIRYGSYFGGALSQEHVDGGTSRFSESGRLYQSACAGCGGNDDFPIFPVNAWPGTSGNPNHSSNCNNGVFKFDMEPKVTATIATNTISGCMPLAVTFTNLSSPGLIYFWNLGGGVNDTTSMINPVKTYTAAGTYTVKLVAIENQFCNTKDSTTITITVHPNINADFTFTAIPCSDTVKFTNTSTSSASFNSNWLFTGSGTSTSTVNNPVMTFTAPGSYTAQLIATTVNGCSDTIAKPFTIFIFNPAIAPSSTICSGAGPVNLSASGGTSYTWQPAGSVSNPNIANPSTNPSVTTVYSVNIQNGSCSRTLTLQVTVNPKPVADFNFTVNPCGGGVDFADLSATNINSWIWNFGTDTSSIQNPFTFYTTGGTYTVNLIVSNIWGCKDTVAKPLTVVTPPPVAVAANQTICIGQTAQLTASGGVAYFWEPPLMVTNPYVFNPYTSPTVNTQYTVTISTLNGVGDTCKFKLKTNVFVSQLSTVPLSVTAVPDSIELGSTTVLTLLGDAGMIPTWFPFNDVNPQYSYTTIASPLITTTYTVTVKKGPCTQTLYVTVFVYKPGCESADVFVPNTFTPNGDGSNDIMFARCNKTTELYFAIYNRWGEMVFETKDKNQGWDGNYKGRPADIGVFGYYVKFKCFNGEESFKKGNITLIR